MNSNTLHSIFKSPPPAYRGKPFWAWNGKLDEEELRRQVGIFQEMGMGGAFMHSRNGLETKYLSKDWFAFINACVDEAKNRKMEMWLYDEDRFPSGAAGGIVTKNPKYRMRFLRVEVLDEFPKEQSPDLLGIWGATFNEDAISNVRVLGKDDVLKTGEKVITCEEKVDPSSEWYNHQTYLDTLSEEAVAKFIEVTHQSYLNETVRKFDQHTVPGIFTDEPNYGNNRFDSETIFRLAWSINFRESFLKHYGYDLVKFIPEIVFRKEGEEFSAVRKDFLEHLTTLLAKNYYGQIGSWCEKNNLLFTGHAFFEATLKEQCWLTGSAMRMYVPMQAPGIDVLCAQGLERKGGLRPEYITAKQCASVVHQFGKKWMLSETYGCTGWDFTFAEHKAVGDWQAALGVNMRCHHLSYYTMEGEAKRDFPASIFYQSAWWKEYKKVEDYFTRIGTVLSEGTPVRDLAVIHPIESGWGLFSVNNFRWTRKPNHKTVLDKLDHQLESLVDWLLQEHYDFDFLDEQLLAEHGTVSRGQIKMPHAGYKVVLAPPMKTIRSRTLEMLEALSKQGGTVIFTDELPEFIDAEPIHRHWFLKTWNKVPFQRDSIIGELKNCPILRRPSIQDLNGKEFTHALYQFREDPKTGCHYLFICNTSQTISSEDLTIKLPIKGYSQEWDPFSSSIYESNQETTANQIILRTSLPPYGSRLFVIEKEKPKNQFVKKPSTSILKEEVLNPSLWKILRDEPNAFVLDSAEFQIENGPWQKPMDTLHVDAKIRSSAGLTVRRRYMCQPWADATKTPGVNIPVQLRYHFQVEELPGGICHLVVEKAATFSITLNGKMIDSKTLDGWWIDKSFQKLQIPPNYFKQGTNELILKTVYTSDSGLESIYVTGEFGVEYRDNIPTVTSLPTHLKLGDWTRQGFPCYGGSLKYVYEAMVSKKDSPERLYLELTAWEGVHCNVIVNGSEVGSLPWPPFEMDLTDALRDGRNEIEIQIYGSRRNLLGPLHFKDPNPIWTGPEQFFITDPAKRTDEYIRKPYGLMSPPKLSHRTVIEKSHHDIHQKHEPAYA